MPNDSSSQPLTDAERCQPVYVHTYGLDRETWEALFDRVAEAAHALDEEVSCSGGNDCTPCEDPDWADVREAARKTGYELQEIEPSGGWRVWGIFRREGPVARGTFRWIRAVQGPVVVRVEINDDEYENGFHLQDPTPAEVLTAARLVGLDQDGSEA